MYYRLTNFFQNNRKYVKSFDSKQLLGYVESLTADCDPLGFPKDGAEWVVANGVNTTVRAESGKPRPQYYPCGLIANSLFSDDISNLTCINSNYAFPSGQICAAGSNLNVQYQFDSSSIAWPSDSDKYGNIKDSLKNIPDSQIPTTLIPPPYWRKAFPKWANGYNASNLPDLKSWTALQVWMRTAGLPTFRKLWGRNDNVLPHGTWQLDIVQNFDVSHFSGTKSIVISSVSVLGGKNGFLGIAYICVGTVCCALGIAFLARHLIKPRKLGDHNYLSWNQPHHQQRPAFGGPESQPLH
nr:hypothetical protein HK105_007370 [Polyrhizophydium stewartii]